MAEEKIKGPKIAEEDQKIIHGLREKYPEPTLRKEFFFLRKEEKSRFNFSLVFCATLIGLLALTYVIYHFTSPNSDIFLLWVLFGFPLLLMLGETFWTFYYSKIYPHEKYPRKYIILLLFIIIVFGFDN